MMLAIPQLALPTGFVPRTARWVTALSLSCSPLSPRRRGGLSAWRAVQTLEITAK